MKRIGILKLKLGLMSEGHMFLEKAYLLVSSIKGRDDGLKDGIE